MWPLKSTDSCVMETIQRKAKNWWPAFFAATRYVAYNVLLTYSAWLHVVKDRWETLTSWDRYVIATELSLAALLALGAIMNGTWTEAKTKDRASPP